jgi:GNAT superfamily N-acetyltransferase
MRLPAHSESTVPANADFLNRPREAAVADRAATTAAEARPVEGLEGGIDDILPWLHESSNPYWDWLWGSPGQAWVQLTHWFERPNSELARGRVRSLRRGRRVLGGYIAASGQQLRSCRKADVLALMNYLRRTSDESVVARMHMSRSLFASVADNAFYLSRIGVASAARGRGAGRHLLDMFIREGRSRGYARFQLDVSEDKLSAFQLYLSAGFKSVGTSTIPGTSIRYHSMVRSS